MAPHADHQSLDTSDVSQVRDRYAEEREKRLRDEGLAQNVELSLSDKFRHLYEDPWIDDASIKDIKTMFPSNRCPQVLILGAGWGGLLYAVRMIQAGARPEDIRIVDPAGGFGGTWYFNRYPGLMCDIESYCYLPLLEEMDYMPKHRYSSGDEIRKYANLVAEKFGLVDNAVFQTKAEKLVWDEENKEWQVELVQTRTGQPPERLSVRSQFVTMVNGVLNWPKLPDVPGVLDYQGQIFHTSRWDYSITGGSPADPSMEKLKDKRVAIIGTGPTSLQAVPHLARWSKHLYVIQRTPSSVDVRGQRETDPSWFKKEVANAPGWQNERNKNFNEQFTTEEQPAVNLVDDGWTHAVGMVPVVGNPDGPKTMEEVPAYIKKIHAIDLPRMNRIRDRAKQIVKDPSVAEKLQAWYPTWCKRPGFHDEYLQAFNQDNVSLIDTGGKGLDSLTADSVVVGDQSYPVDIIIFGTGFRPPFGRDSPAEKANLTITGRNGVDMSQEWAKNGASTLHGVIDHNFPNLFLSGPWQGAVCGNYAYMLDTLAQHGAYILAEAKSRANGESFAVAPSREAADAWREQILMAAPPMAANVGCTPGYFNLEGEVDRMSPEKKLVLARSSVLGTGAESFLEKVRAWRATGHMPGIEVQT